MIVSASSDTLLRQAKITAEDYVGEACVQLQELHTQYGQEWTIADAVALAKIMATDFNTSLMSKTIEQASLNIERGLTKVSVGLDDPII